MDAHCWLSSHICSRQGWASCSPAPQISETSRLWGIKAKFKSNQR